MKTFIALMILMASLTAIAGPEDHIQNQKCYTLSNQDSQRASKNIPREICLETLTIDTQNETIDIYSYFYPQFFESMKVDNLVRRNEDFFVFTASNILSAQEDTQSGQLQKVTLIINGQVDFLGVGNPSYLDVNVNEVRRNTSHSRTTTNTYHYDLQ